MVFLISCCSKSTTEKEIDYFINEDFKNIVDRIIEIDDLSNSLIITKEEENSFFKINIFAFDYLENCEDVVSIFEYRQKIIILINYSKGLNFNKLIDLDKVKNLTPCKEYIKPFKDDDYTDYKAFSFHYDKENILYLDNTPIKYENHTVILEKFNHWGNVPKLVMEWFGNYR